MIEQQFGLACGLLENVRRIRESKGTKNWRGYLRSTYLLQTTTQTLASVPWVNQEHAAEQPDRSIDG